MRTLRTLLGACTAALARDVSTRVGLGASTFLPAGSRGASGAWRSPGAEGAGVTAGRQRGRPLTPQMRAALPVPASLLVAAAAGQRGQA